MSLQYNLLAIPIPQKSEPNSRLEKFAPVDLTSWSATGGKMAGEPCQRSEVDTMILMFRKMHYTRLQILYVYAFPSTEMLNVKFES